jgi:hypothetical protein
MYDGVRTIWCWMKVGANQAVAGPVNRMMGLGLVIRDPPNHEHAAAHSL